MNTKEAMQSLFTDLIVIEGSDGSGKKTQSNMLYNFINKNSTAKCTLLDFPDYESETGLLISTMLNGKYGTNAATLNSYFTSPMYSLDRYQYYLKLIRDNPYRMPSIGICNRYTDSNLIHQGCRLDKEDLMEYWAWLYDFEYNKLGIPKPSIVIYLDIPFQVSYENILRRAEETGANIDINEQEDYLRLVYDHVHRIADIAGWKVINCYDDYEHDMRSREDIFDSILAAIRTSNNIKLNNVYYT